MVEEVYNWLDISRLIGGSVDVLNFERRLCIASPPTLFASKKFLIPIISNTFMSLKEKRYDTQWPTSRQSREWVRTANRYRRMCKISKGELTRIAVDFLINNVKPKELSKVLREHDFYHCEK